MSRIPVQLGMQLQGNISPITGLQECVVENLESLYCCSIGNRQKEAAP